MKYVLHPIATEKAIRLMESENKLQFVVRKESNKKQIVHELEKFFKIKITKINTFVDPKGRKKAIVKLHTDYPAIDVATQLGMI